MIESPLVTICIPTFNGDRFIASTLESVLNQTYRNLEILISDQNSTDNTFSIINSYTDNRIKISSFKTGKSAADNWNASISNVRGKYVKLLCQDDLLKRDCIRLQVEAMEGNPVASFCFSNRDIISPRGRLLLKRRGYKPLNSRLSLEDGLAILVRSGTNIFGEPCAVLMRTEALQATVGFRGSYLIDLDMWIQLWIHGESIYIPQSVSQFRISNSSWSTVLSELQASQIAAFLKGLQISWPDFVSDADVELGIKKSLRYEKQRQFITHLVEKIKY